MQAGQQSQFIYDYQDFQIDEESANSAKQKAATQVALAQSRGISYDQIKVVQRQQQQPVVLQSQQQTFSEPQKAHLASKIADLLIKESADQTVQSKGKKSTPFVKEALPGENQKVQLRSPFLGFVKISSLTYVALHLFVNASVYDLWGNGSWYMIAISALQLICSAYSYLLSSTHDMEQLITLFSLRTPYLAVVGIVSTPVALVTLVAFYAFVEADQIASYTISSNLLQYSFTTLFPFLTLVAFTYFLWEMRQYELDDVNIDFKPDYHFGPDQTVTVSSSKSKKQAVSDKKLSRDLTMELLQRYLEEPTMAPVPDLHQVQTNEQKQVQVRII